MGTASLASAPPRLRASAPLPLQLLPRPPGLCISKGSGGKRLDVRQDPRVLRGVTCLTCGPPSGPVPVWVPLVFPWDSAVSQEQAESWPRFRRFESVPGEGGGSRAGAALCSNPSVPGCGSLGKSLNFSKPRLLQLPNSQAEAGGWGQKSPGGDSAGSLNGGRQLPPQPPALTLEHLAAGWPSCVGLNQSPGSTTRGS